MFGWRRCDCPHVTRSPLDDTTKPSKAPPGKAGPSGVVGIKKALATVTRVGSCSLRSPPWGQKPLYSRFSVVSCLLRHRLGFSCFSLFAAAGAGRPSCSFVVVADGRIRHARPFLSLCMSLSLLLQSMYHRIGWWGHQKGPRPLPFALLSIHTLLSSLHTGWGASCAVCRVPLSWVYARAHTTKPQHTQPPHTRRRASVLRLKYNQPRRLRPPTARPAYRNHMASCSFVRELRQGPW